MRSKNRRGRALVWWALSISLAVHAVALPFFGLRAQAHPTPEATGVLRIDDIATPRPRPTPPPASPPPVRTPHAVRAQRPRVTAVHVRSAHQHAVALAPPPGNAPSVPVEDPGSAAPGPAGPAEPSAAPVLAPAPTPSPSPPATPKPQCSMPNADASIVGEAVEPEFPPSARDRGASGTAQIRVALDATGAVTEAGVERSSGFAELDAAALAAAKATRYTPAIVDCRRSAGEYLFRADFDAQ